MKKLMVAIAAAAISFAGFADDTNKWFTAGFGDGVTSTGGGWVTEGSVTEPSWNEATLQLVDVEAAAPVVFAADEAKAGASTNADTTVVFDTTVTFQGFEELPAIDTGAKAGVCALTDGNYYVVAYDDVGSTNKWVDTGIEAAFGAAVNVKVTVAKGKAVYTFTDQFGTDGTDPLDLVDAEFQEVCYSGNGSVSTLAADTILAGVEIIVPTIEGLKVTCDKVRAGIGDEVTLSFEKDTKFPSIPSAVYIVGDDGTLTRKPGETQVEALDPGAKIGTVIYLTFNEAYEAATEDDEDPITLCTDQYLESDIEKSIKIDLAGNDLTVTNGVAINGVEVVFDDSAEEVKGKLVLEAALSVADDGASLVVSAITFECDGGYLTGVGGIISVSEDLVSANKMLAEGSFGEEPEDLSVIVYVGDSVYNGAGDRFAVEGEVAYATVGEEDAQYIESFASVQAAIEAADEVYLCFDFGGVEYPEEDITFADGKIVYAEVTYGEDALANCNLLPDGEVEFDPELNDGVGGWVYTGESPTEDIKLSWTENATKMTVLVSIDGYDVTDNPAVVETGDVAEFIVLPKDGYEYATVPDGWFLRIDGGISNNFEVAEESIKVEVPEPTEIPATTVQISLPAAIEGVAGYIVSNVTDNVAIAADVQEEPVVGSATYTLPLGKKVEIWVVPADGYRVTGNPYVINEVTTGTTVDVEDLPSVAAIPYVAQIGTDKFETLAAAAAAATSGQTVTVLADLAQTESIEVEGKDITFDLNGKTLTFNVSGDGFYFFNDADCSVTNGTIVMNVPATANWYSAIYFEDAGGLVKDVTINSGNCKYGVVTGVDDYESLEGTADKTVVCENVDVTGSGLLFYAEAEKMTLDADCSATQIGTNPAGATYSDALAAGWLGQLTVNGGEYTADANVVGTMSSPATITLNAGTYSGNFNYVPVSEGYKSMGDHLITKAEEVVLAAPEGYKWDADGLLVPVTYVAQVGEDKYETVEAALAAVQALEAAEDFPIEITALAEDGLTITDTDRTASIEKDVKITIPEAGSWEVDGTLTYSGAIEGSVTATDIVIPDDGSITLGVDALVTVGLASKLEEASFIAPSGYKVAVMATMETKSFKVEETVLFGGGNGSEATPYIISEYAHLVELKAWVIAGNKTEGVYFQQTANISFAGEDPWTGIGEVDTAADASTMVEAAAFKGVYDGNGMAITDVTFAKGQKYAGFFNQMSGATIKNLSLEIAGIEDDEGGYGMLFGLAKDCEITDVVISGSATGSHNVGGFGIKAQDTVFTRCANNMTACGSTADKVGGFVAFDYLFAGTTGLEFVDCTNAAPISAKRSDVGRAFVTDGAGGFIGSVYAAPAITFTRCVSTGTVTFDCNEMATDKVAAGSFIGWTMKSVTATSCEAITGQLPLNASEAATIAGLNYAIVTNGRAAFLNADAVLVKNTEYTQFFADASEEIFVLEVENDWIAFRAGVEGVELPTNGQVKCDAELTLDVDDDEAGYVKFTAVVAAPAWDIPGANGGINALVKEDGVTKYVEFTSVDFSGENPTIGLKAAKIAAQAETFGLVCKTDLTKGDTFVINASLSVAEGDPDAKNGLFTISTDLSDYDQLFVVGVGPAKAE